MSGTEIKAAARQQIRNNTPKVFIIAIIYIVLVTIMSELQFRLPGTPAVYDRYLEVLSVGILPSLADIYSFFRPSGVPFAIVLWVLTAVVEIGFMSYCLKVSRDQKGETKDLFDGFLFFGKVIIIKIVTGIFVLLWTLLFIIPGFVASYRYRQAYYILLDDPQKGALQCIRESKQLMKSKKLDLFLLDLSFIGWALLNFLVVLLLPLPFSLPIISIWVTPYTGLTFAEFYNGLVYRVTV